MIFSFSLNILFFISAGEDGQVKIWSRSGMLRSTLTQNSKLLMGESFQDYFWSQDFEADFPQKVSLKMLN